MMTGSIDERFAFQAGNYCSVEPGLYIKDVGALRFERNVAIHEGRLERYRRVPVHLVIRSDTIPVEHQK